MLERAISGNMMGTLISQPFGCGEQNMITMTLPVIATMYLDKTNQWEDVGFHRRADGLRHIQTGRLQSSASRTQNTSNFSLQLLLILLTRGATHSKDC